MSGLAAPIDAVVLLSFGGPEGPDDVVPFLENVTRGRNIPRERLVEVGAHYELFDGVSPINDQNRGLREALERGLVDDGIHLPVALGNRNWRPFIEDVAQDLASQGHRHALAIVTSAFGSYSGCRQYREDLDRATEATGGRLVFTKSRLYWNHPGFLDALAARMRSAMASVPAGGSTRLVFTAHSIPTAWSASSPYVAQLRAAAAQLAATAAPGFHWDLAFQSRSGPPQVPWLEPDIVDHLRTVADEGVRTTVVVPLGFVSDHMEVVYDLDTEAAATASDLGLSFVRVPTVGTHPRFSDALVDIVREQVSGAPALVAVGEPWPNPCPEGCCERPPRR